MTYQHAKRRGLAGAVAVLALGGIALAGCGSDAAGRNVAAKGPATARSGAATDGPGVEPNGTRVTGASPSAAAPAGSPAPANAGRQAADAARYRLFEATTPRKEGYFYTINPAEAKRAVRYNHFSPTGATLGYLYSRRVTGTVPVYRLRLRSRMSYLVTPSKTERDRLVAGGSFRNEGVLGYIALKPGSGRMAICRVSKNSVWKVIRTSQAKTFKKRGWTGCDGVGYTWTGA